MNHFTAFFLGVLLGALIVLLMIASYVEGKKAGRREGYQPKHNYLSAPQKPSSKTPKPTSHPESPARASVVPPTTAYPPMPVPEIDDDSPAGGLSEQER